MRKKIVYLAISCLIVFLGLKLQVMSEINYCRVNNEIFNDLELAVSRLKRQGDMLEFQMQNTENLCKLAMGHGSVCSRAHFSPEMYDYAWVKLDGVSIEGLGEAICSAERDYGVNGLFLAAVAYHESERGCSWMAKNKNNLFGLNAIDGAEHLSFTFDKPEESIEYVARLLSRDYLDRRGRYYNGKTPAAIGKKYASDPLWSEKVCRIMQMILVCMLSGGDELKKN